MFRMFENEIEMSQTEVHFELYPLDPASIDLKILKINLITFLLQKSKDYIWNYSPLRIIQNHNHIFGELNFGDLYDEEWLLAQFLLGSFKCLKHTFCVYKIFSD